MQVCVTARGQELVVAGTVGDLQSEPMAGARWNGQPATQLGTVHTTLAPFAPTCANERGGGRCVERNHGVAACLSQQLDQRLEGTRMARSMGSRRTAPPHGRGRERAADWAGSGSGVDGGLAVGAAA